MRPRARLIAFAIAGLAAIGFVLLAPVVYFPEVAASGCNLTCASGGHNAYYASISSVWFGLGGCYWPPGWLFSNYYFPC